MGVLAHVLEAAGLATVGISLIRGQAETVRAPRMLHCQFPLGRPLGRPDDPDFQHDVLRRAFALLPRTDVPVLEDHPMVIDDETDAPLACSLPPRFDPALPAALDEVAGLRAAYDRQLARSGRTLVGRTAGADGIAGLVEKFLRLADGAPLDEVGLSGSEAIAAAQDVRAFYEEAALALADHTPAARQAESWFYTATETGRTLKAARDRLEADGGERNVWYYLTPASQ